ncbi:MULTISPECIES: tripartite tricarboxylate transporter substrate binding protein [Ureibacillus]|jgi:putative tricarboxylic transport membrane protein|uniref:Putative tricarboxylic transport membrane protein n=1 Tax=Ureibacillus thermosphaericus TaxID=51173 RepID=A0A840PZS0_URETH|nr:tripartite tricarboxylate transporter substrate binding protein [Ureibacillus thermosphaericus]MBB5150132.1 putative tricarboxylic transport membrane protein [Ureibacillus thermosphaericus]NKZ32767.1 tripartite tricarboxylate transporter substrate binding protein [Ureibacillus thermosphaericus]
MKKWVTFLIISIVAVLLTACGKSEGSSSGSGKGNYPNSTITIVAPTSAGGGWDLTARAIAKNLSETKLVEKPIVVENKPGGGGVTFMATFATKEANNDYMLMVKSPPIIINNLKAEGNSQFGFRDTTPLAQLTKDYGAIAVKADSKYQTLFDLLEDIKRDPKSVTLAGASSPGSMDHLITILPVYKYGIDPKSVKYVSFDGGGESVALLGGNADAIGTDVSTISQYVKSGQVRVLAVTAPERVSIEGLEDVPTLKELGLDTEFTIWRGIFGPKEMSQEAKEYWIEKLTALNETEEWKEDLARNGWQQEFKSGEDFEKFLEEQEVVISDLLKALGMHK